ncbi:hypothetical protein JCM1840_007277 [Sporobolomyces johnsonii]
MAPPLKRPLPSTQSTQSSQPSQSSPSSAIPPPPKRTKLAPPSPSLAAAAPPSAQSLRVPETPVPSASSIQDTPAKADLPPLPPPHKRTFHPGALRRLSSGHPSSTKGKGKPSIRPKSTLSGTKIGGKSKDLRDGASQEEIWVTRKGGLGFAGWLKAGVAAFMERGCTCLTVHGMGAAIPLALSLALAIRDAIPGGASSESDDDDQEEEEERGPGQRELVKMDVTTGSTTVGDEITPDDDDADVIYQSRQKSTVSVSLTLDPALATSVGLGPGVKRGGDAGRGGRRRGGPKGRNNGGGRGRGRGR